MTLRPPTGPTPRSRAECEALDASDPLARFRAEFALPDEIIYLDGNSLGALPRRTSARMRRTIEEEWGRDLIKSWNTAGWWEQPVTLGDRLAPLLGAAPGQVVICDSTSVDLFKTVIAALRSRPERRVIVSDANAFPTDLYIAEGVSGLLDGVEHRRATADGTAGTTATATAANEAAAAGTGEGGGALADALARVLDDQVAVVVLSHVDYRTGRLHDMAAITELVHRHGALMIWDLCHSAGAVPIELDACGVDFAVGCTYKYLNGGPGSPAFVYAARRHLESARQPLTGWWGHAAPFAFDGEYIPSPGIRGFLVGSAPILGCAALEASLEIWEQVDPVALRAKSLALTGLFLALGERLGLEPATPLDPARRGSQVSFRHPDGYPIVQALIERGVIGDFRAPDIMRFGFAPLYLRYRDVWDAAEVLGQVLRDESWRDERYAVRATVT